MSHPTVLSVHLSKTHNFSKTTHPRSITLLTNLGVKGDCHCGTTTQHLWPQTHKNEGYRNEPNLRQMHLIQGELYAESGFCGRDGKRVFSGQLGENVTTKAIDLMRLGKGTRLRFVSDGGGREFKCLRNILDGLICATFFALVVIALFFKAKWIHVLAALITHATTILLRVLATYRIQRESAYREAMGESSAVVEVTGMRQPCRKVDVFQEGLKGKLQFRDEKGEKATKAGIMGVVECGGLIKPGMRILVEEKEVWEALPLLP